MQRVVIPIFSPVIGAKDQGAKVTSSIQLTFDSIILDEENARRKFMDGVVNDLVGVFLPERQSLERRQWRYHQWRRNDRSTKRIVYGTLPTFTPKLQNQIENQINEGH